MKLLLTFDLEEFDEITSSKEALKFNISYKGVSLLNNLLLKHDLKATFFTTAKFASTFPELLKKLKREGNEIACHGYSHSDSYIKDLSNIKKAKEEFENLGFQVNGFRAPRFEIKKIEKLSEFGFSYDSSIHPTFVPGRYFNLSKKRDIHKIGNIIEIPPSTLPLIRAPISWFFFKNLGLNYAKNFTKLNSLFSSYTMLLFHPWEFTELKKANLPNSIKRISG